MGSEFVTEVVKVKLFRAVSFLEAAVQVRPRAKIIVTLIQVPVKNRFVCYPETASKPHPSLAKRDTEWCIVLIISSSPESGTQREVGELEYPLLRNGN